MLLSKAIPLAAILVSGAWAQATTEATCPVGNKWNQNSLGQDPCTIGSILDASCRGLAAYTYPSLNSNGYYLPPRTDHTGDILCDCNTVMYSLYMACTSCQGGIIYSWPTWAAQCESVYVTQYPSNIPYGTAIPHWAFYDVTTIPTVTYNDSIAISVGRNPEATPPTSGTTTFGANSYSGSLSFTSSGLKPGSTNTSDDSSSSKVPIAAIAGGVVGAIGFLIVVIAAYFYYLWWCGNEEDEPPAQRDGEVVCDAELKPHPPTNYGPDAPTEPILVPNRLFHLYAPVPAQAEREANRNATRVTPM